VAAALAALQDKIAKAIASGVLHTALEIIPDMVHLAAALVLEDVMVVVLMIFQSAEAQDGKKLPKFAEDAAIISNIVMDAIGEGSNV